MIDWIVFCVIPLLGLCDFDNEPAPGCSTSQWEKTATELLRLLCEAGKVYRGEQQPSAALLKWWKEHEESDRKKSC